MEIQGKIIAALPEVTGISKTTGNPWKKRDYVLETHDQYPRKVAFDLFGDKVDQYPLEVGEEVVVSFDIESREYNGRWYTNLRAWKVEKGAGAAAAAPAGYATAAPAPAPAPAPAYGYQTPAPVPPAPAGTSANNPDDLPF